jgi:site-specific DNA-cytosine methylase
MLHVAGSPCVDFSSMGAGLGKDGPIASAFMAWIALVLLLNFSVIIHENVNGFPDKLFELLSERYVIHQIPVDALSLGWPVNRNRCYRVMVHKHKVNALLAPLDVVARLFERDLRMCWREFLVASTAELESELCWATRRPGAMHAVIPELMSFFQPDTDTTFVQALNEFEQRNLLGYLRTTGRGLVHCLRQTFADHGVFSTMEVLKTITKNAGLCFADVPRQPRWLTPYELLLAQGMPTDARYFSACGGLPESSFSVPCTARCRH